MTGELAKRVRELVRDVCKTNEVEIIKGHISTDHVHLFVSVPPHISVSKLMQYIKGKSSRKIMSEFKTFSKMYWGRHFWARGYFVVSSGTITDEMIMEYIENQDLEDKDGDSSRNLYDASKIIEYWEDYENNKIPRIPHQDHHNYHEN